MIDQYVVQKTTYVWDGKTTERVEKYHFDTYEEALSHAKEIGLGYSQIYKIEVESG